MTITYVLYLRETYFYLIRVVYITYDKPLLYQPGDTVSKTSGPNYFWHSRRFNASLTFFELSPPPKNNNIFCKILHNCKQKPFSFCLPKVLISLSPPPTFNLFPMPLCGLKIAIHVSYQGVHPNDAGKQNQNALVVLYTRSYQNIVS